MPAYYLLPGSAFLSQYQGVEVKQPPKDVWLSVTFTGTFEWEGKVIRNERCSCLANVDGNGKWTFVPHLDNVEPHTASVTVIRLWRLAKESEVPTWDVLQ